MSENWSYRVPHVTPGEPVQAGVVSRPDRALADRTDYLKDRLDAAEAGRAIFDLDATVSTDVLPGHAVYWNAQEKRYEPAIVVVENDEASQSLVSRPSSDCVGMCYRKTAENKADIVLRGLVTFANLNNAIGETVAAGKYYLSAVTPGKLAQQKPPITVTVCYVLGSRDNCSDDLRVIVCPQVRDSLDEHTHYRFDLVPKAAGSLTITAVDDVDHVSITANANLEGWLPADHSSFNGRAPVGAKFGYNLAKHPALQRVWPPIPIQSVAVLWDKANQGGDPSLRNLGATEIPLGPTGAAIVDVNGIWWMSDCREDVPFVENNGDLDIENGACPREEKMRVVLVFLRLLLGNNRRVVTSLDKDITSPIQITNCDGVVAHTGDLKLDLNLQEIDCAPLPADDTTGIANPGGKVFTSVVAAEGSENKNQLKKSWVTEGVIVTSPRLTVSSTHSRSLTVPEKEYHDITTNVVAHQGLIKLGFVDQYADRELSPQIIRLNDAVERIYLDTPYLGFPQGQDSSIRLRFNVPYLNVDDTELQMKMRVQLFTRAGSPTTDGNIGLLLMTYKVIPPPETGSINLVALNEVTTGAGGAALFPTGLQAARDHVIQRDSLPIDVMPGATVLVTFERPVSDATLGEVGILRVSGLLSPKTT